MAPWPLTANFSNIGFGAFRSADRNTPTTSVLISGSQDVVSGPVGNLIYGIGQSTSSFALEGYSTIFAPDPSADLAWTYPVVLARGTYSGFPNSLQIASNSLELTGNVFALEGSPAAPQAKIFAELCPLTGCATQYDGFYNNINANAGGMVTHTFGNSFSIPPLSDFGFELYQPPIASSATAIPAIPATLDPASGKFLWNPLGSLPGTYIWRVTNASPRFSDTAYVTVVVTVPEPVTAALLVVASCIGFIFSHARSVRITPN